MSLKTAFASAERASAEEVGQQHRMLSQLPFVAEFIDAVPNMAMVLNKHRQIVFANRAFRAKAQIETFLGIGLKSAVDDLAA